MLDGFDFVIAFVFLLGTVWVSRQEASAMRYSRPALVGLLGGFLLAIAVFAVDFLISMLRLAASAQCVGEVAAACDGAVQFGDVRYLGIAFLVGFAVAFISFRRRQRRRVA
jgi:hypothetical protein